MTKNELSNDNSSLVNNNGCCISSFNNIFNLVTVTIPENESSIATS